MNADRSAKIRYLNAYRWAMVQTDSLKLFGCPYTAEARRRMRPTSSIWTGPSPMRSTPWAALPPTP